MTGRTSDPITGLPAGWRIGVVTKTATRSRAAEVFVDLARRHLA